MYGIHGELRKDTAYGHRYNVRWNESKMLAEAELDFTQNHFDTFYELRMRLAKRA